MVNPNKDFFIMEWNTKEVVEHLSTILNVKIEINEPGGDCDTENICIYSTLEQPTNTIIDGEIFEEQNAITICGLVEELGNHINDPSNPTVNIPYIEIRSLNADSSGGLDEDASDEVIRIYNEVQKKLRKAYGKTFRFVQHYNEVY